MMRGIGKRNEGTPAVTLPLTTTEREGENSMSVSTTRPDTSSQRYDTASPRYDSAAQTRPATGELNALLGKGSEFDGKLTFEGTVRIDGTFSGEITTSDTLIVGEGAKVSAEITCGTLIVHGDVTGNISASTAVELHKPARVKGDVSTPALVIERGVLYQGTSKMTEQTSSNVVRFASSAESASD